MSRGTSNEVKIAHTTSDILYSVAGWLLIGLGVFGILSVLATVIAGPDSVSIFPIVLSLLFAILFIVFGVFVNSGIRHRLSRRRSVTRFGRTKAVDNRVLRSNEDKFETCAECDTQMDEGLNRRYRDEFLFVGIPMYSFSEGYNYYCTDCALSDREVLMGRDQSTDEDGETFDEMSSSEWASE